jgi:hypothetical protein
LSKIAKKMAKLKIKCKKIKNLKKKTGRRRRRRRRRFVAPRPGTTLSHLVKYNFFLEETIYLLLTLLSPFCL